MSSTFFKNPIFVQIGYEEKTTFWRDFSIAELYGKNGIKDTYERAKQDWQDDIEFMTELAMVLNHKLWFWSAQKPNNVSSKEEIEALVKLYDNLWSEIDSFIFEHFENDKEAISYYLRVTD